MSSKTVQLQQTAQYIEELEAENTLLKKKLAELQRVNAKLYENVERFVTRKTINDFPIDLKDRDPQEYFDFRIYKRGQNPETRNRHPLS